MKFTATLSFLVLIAGSAVAFAPLAQQKPSSTALQAFSVNELPGVVGPTGLFDPLGFSKNAPEAVMKRYRESELVHGRVAMLATVGFLMGEKAEGSIDFINGPAITHLQQIPVQYSCGMFVLASLIAGAEFDRAYKGWVPPGDVPVGQQGLMRDEYVAGNLGFDPLGLKPEDSAEFEVMQTKELQNGRLAMLAAAGFMAQELVTGKGILENFGF